MTREEAIERIEFLKGVYSVDTEMAFDMAIEALKDRPQGEWKHTITWQPYCSNCEYVFDEDEEYSPFWKFCPMCGAEMADNSLVNNITESPNDVIESQDDVIKKPRTVRYKLHKPIEYVSIEVDEEEEITHIGHYTAYGERRETHRE